MHFWAQLENIQHILKNFWSEIVEHNYVHYIFYYDELNRMTESSRILTMWQYFPASQIYQQNSV
jgi:hypothetical protein